MIIKNDGSCQNKHNMKQEHSSIIILGDKQTFNLFYSNKNFIFLN
uniref:Uncharacterized protein n=1 Tax=Lepeophtheirus salmonis TaxID=72036 RepID=A0A0K2TZ45_LEPSM